MNGAHKNKGVERIRPEFVSDEKREAALVLFKQGSGYVKAGRILGIPAYVTRDWGRAFRKGTFDTALKTNQYRYPEEVKKQVIELRKSGVLWREVARLTGVPESTCRKWVTAYESSAVDTMIRNSEFR